MVCCCIVQGLWAQSDKTPVKSKTTYSYNIKGESSKQIKETFQRYDQHGNKVEEIEYSEDGDIKKHLLYTYDSKHNRTMIIQKNEDGEVRKKTTFAYDSYGNRTEKKVFDGNGKLKSKKTYAYEYHR